MKQLNLSRLFAATLFVALLALTGCVQPEMENETEEITIFGKWVDDYEAYNAYIKYDCKIDFDSVETASYEKHNSPVYIKMTSKNSGYIYYKFTSDITGYDSSYNSFSVPSTGKWGAIAFKDLKAGSVKMCDVYDSSYDFPDTLEACIAKYTVDDGYFANMIAFKKL